MRVAWLRRPLLTLSGRLGGFPVNPWSPVHRDLLCEPRRGGRQRPAALGHALGWGKQRARSCVCCKHGFCLLSETALLAAPSLKAPPGRPSQRSPALDSLGGRDVQGLVRNGQGQEAGLHLGTRGWVTHVTGTNRRMVPTSLPTMSSDPFLGKLSRPKAQPVRTP